MKSGICHCFIDTNTFLHYRYFTEIDWCQELGANRVILVICTTVLRELDQKKFSDSDSKIRDRAKKNISKLWEISNVNKQVEVRPNVELLLLSREPKIDWDSEGLSPKLPDDRIIATLIHERVNLENIAFVTADLGLKLKAKSKGIRCLTLSDNLLLKHKRSPEEEEIANLRARISCLENRLPVLKIKLISEDGIDSIGRFCLQKISTFSSASIENRLNKLKNKLQYFPTDKKNMGPLSSVILNYFWPSQDEIDRYKTSVEKYINEYHEYLEQDWKYKEKRSRIIELRFVLVNEGSSPAEDIDVFLYFPSGFELCDSKDIPNAPVPPYKPVPPKNLFQKMTDMQRGLTSYIPQITPLKEIISSSHTDMPKGPIIRKIKSYEVNYKLLKLKQDLHIEFEPVYAIFSSIESAQSFKVAYSIIVGNPPEKIKGQVHIVLNTTSKET